MPGSTDPKHNARQDYRRCALGTRSACRAEHGDLSEAGAALVDGDFAVQDHHAEVAEVADVRGGVGVQYEEVGALAGGQRAEVGAGELP